MFHYLFTNDLRISKLEKSLKEAGECFLNDNVPSATVDKNANNNMNTLGFYFNLTKESSCSKACADGNIRVVVLNFIKKFQFPNPRTTESLEDTIKDNIQIAPMRIILQTLYFMMMKNPTDSYLTKNEVLNYIFFNEEIAKSENPDTLSLAQKIIKDRKTDSAHDEFPSDDAMEGSGYYWKQCKRQVREMIKVLCWSGCIIENDSDGSISIHHDHLSQSNKADLFDILTCTEKWVPQPGKTASEHKESYQKYMDLSTSNIVSDNSDDILIHNLYGIHIKELNDALSEENPHICIGWSCLGNLSDIESRDALAKRYDEHIQKEPRGKGQDVGQVWRFINDVKIGDYIIFADDAVCHIGRVESDYYFDDTENPNENPDYANKRKVTWLKKNIERSSLSTAFHRSLMTAMSIWGLNDYKSSVVELLKGTYIKDIVEDLGEVVENITNEPSQQKALFKSWMQQQRNANGESYSENTINSYIGQMERGYAEFDKYHDFESVFQIKDAASLAEYTEYLFNANGFGEFNDRAGNNACRSGLTKYNEFLSNNIEQPKINYKTNCKSTFFRNRILFGAPGTGKSFTLEEERKILLYGEAYTNNKDTFDENAIDLRMYGKYERVTFHPDYSYANFVGTYKPVPCKTDDNKDAITYKYVPGPFMRLYVKALQNSRTEDAKPHLLIVEEINRANVAAVFGDIFQLLDRDNDDVSDYPIQASEDIKKYLADELGGNPNNYDSLRIPNNMFIWATMNSADQGVFPMDTAFKRRWDFTYLGINTSEDGIRGKKITLGTGANTRTVEWNTLRKEINNKLSSMKINEDKLLGPYFLSQRIVPTETDIDPEKFIESFKSKILMYLFDDAAKQKRASLFADNIDTSKYSEICKAFDDKGVLIFCSDISNKFPAPQPMDGEEQ